MKSRRMWAVVAVAAAVAVGSGFAIPAAVGASPHAKAVTQLCTATGKKPVGNAGAISLSAKGTSKSTGVVVGCAAKVKGKWAKNSTQFSFDTTGSATVGKGGTWTLDPKTDLRPFAGKVTGTLTGGGLSGGSSIQVEIHCWFSYPPLKYGCEIIISSL